MESKTGRFRDPKTGRFISSKVASTIAKIEEIEKAIRQEHETTCRYVHEQVCDAEKRGDDQSVFKNRKLIKVLTGCNIRDDFVKRLGNEKKEQYIENEELNRDRFIEKRLEKILKYLTDRIDKTLGRKIGRKFIMNWVNVINILLEKGVLAPSEITRILLLPNTIYYIICDLERMGIIRRIHIDKADDRRYSIVLTEQFKDDWNKDL